MFHEFHKFRRIPEKIPVNVEFIFEKAAGFQLVTLFTIFHRATS